MSRGFFLQLFQDGCFTGVVQETAEEKLSEEEVRQFVLATQRVYELATAVRVQLTTESANGWARYGRTVCCMSIAPSSGACQ